MTPLMKFIMHGLASGRVQSSPRVLSVLKELQREQESSRPGNDPQVTPASPPLPEEASPDQEKRARSD
jgi:hypothetical protein